MAIGYGSVKKQDLTTAVSVVSNEDMKLRPVSEASGFIQGKVAGVQVQQTSGLPGGGHDGQDTRCIFNRAQQ